MTEATLDPEGLEAAAKAAFMVWWEPRDVTWEVDVPEFDKKKWRMETRAAVLAYLAAIETPRP